jgi:branched-chain amino acid transport system ATP-binding protein
MAVIECENVTKAYGGLVAVNDLSFAVEEGEFFAIVGPNGAGKTTLFDTMSGHAPLTSGVIRFDGRDVHRARPHEICRMGLSRTFQQSKLFHGLTVEDNVHLAVLGVRNGHLRPVRSRRDAEMRERAREVATMMGLGDQLDRAAAELGHGEQRQLEVAMARATDPKLMMLDEPAAGLSRSERQRLTELLLKLDPDITLILIEHDMDVALRVADWVTMMHDGRVIAEGTPAEIRANETVHELYLGSHHADE